MKDPPISTRPLPDTSHVNFNLVYEPSEDTLFLLDAFEEHRGQGRDATPILIAEIGPGSGLVATSICQWFDSNEGLSPFCLCIDKNPDAAEATKQTAKKNGVGMMDVLIGDLVSNIRRTSQAETHNSSFDLILFNPPYVPTSEDELEHPPSQLTLSWAGGEGGRSVIDRLAWTLPVGQVPSTVSAIMVL
eukprot:GHVN01063316.1.p1 GENE.GHVN01063316.1~~GHVN01063316.1.p1  ORF type:complete len:189 (+),score=22.58 GHVN01063316.1:37-603(+)